MLIKSAILACAIQGTPLQIVDAIIHNESRWKPWTVSVNYPSKHQALARTVYKAWSEDKLRSKRDAVAMAHWAQNQAPNVSLSIGLMQVSTQNLARYSSTLDKAMEPCENVRIGSHIYMSYYWDLYQKTGEKLYSALGAASLYNSGNNRVGWENGYVQRFSSRVSSETFAQLPDKKTADFTRIAAHSSTLLPTHSQTEILKAEIAALKKAIERERKEFKQMDIARASQKLDKVNAFAGTGSREINQTDNTPIDATGQQYTAADHETLVAGFNYAALQSTSMSAGEDTGKSVGSDDSVRDRDAVATHNMQDNGAARVNGVSLLSGESPIASERGQQVATNSGTDAGAAKKNQRRAEPNNENVDTEGKLEKVQDMDDISASFLEAVKRLENNQSLATPSTDSEQQSDTAPAVNTAQSDTAISLEGLYQEQ